MAIRLRRVNGTLIAICAARSVPKEGDIYLDDEAHTALSSKFARDFNEMFDTKLPTNSAKVHHLVLVEESNNANRGWWEETYGEQQS